MKATTLFIVFPHQLFKDISLLKNADVVYLVEEFLFFNQYRFHKQKLVLHRASMKGYENYLHENGLQVHYIKAIQKQSDIQILIDALAVKNNLQIQFYDPCDDWLQKRILSSCVKNNISTLEHPTPLFINTKTDLHEYFGNKQKYFQTDFYIQQRKKLEILIAPNGKPIGGKWSFDSENRLKYPKDQTPPKIQFPEPDAFFEEAVDYVEKHYPENLGNLSRGCLYPYTHQQSEVWLEDFITTRLADFGAYEDAIVEHEHFLNHSILTPMLNIGLLLPLQIVDAALAYAEKNPVPLNSLEGFIRQIIGWREFIRAVYCYKGIQERTTNFWQFNKPVPNAFYKGASGITPIDQTIRKLLDTAYNHHIERLMLLGNFMLLCEIHPNAVYKWFMEMYIDAYDWVMVPNVYGMSQFADGGLMATKPYISGSSYVLKMSHYKKDQWCLVWDALFWHFMNRQREFFLSNPRLGMLIRTYDQMSDEKKANFETVAKDFFVKDCSLKTNEGQWKLI